MSSSNINDAILNQREKLTALLSKELRQLASKCVEKFNDRHQLEHLLSEVLPNLTYCKHLFILDADGNQLTDNITQTGKDKNHFGRNRMDRPYMQGIIGTTDFKLSEAYISRNRKRPSFTAIQVIRNIQGSIIGFLGADFDLRELPGTKEGYQESGNWRQIKGDPAIRSVLFSQQRTDSVMDNNLDDVLHIMNELITGHGIFHGKLYFSSSRATIWMVDDPFSYRILNIDELVNPDICLAYPKRSYHERAIVPENDISAIFEIFRRLRFADENVYLRAGSLNIINGMVGLNFSCDGSHYMRFDEFLEKNLDFWFGSSEGLLMT
jgi:hypothetical protein